ncbi:MAG: RsmD family RNA methyltransferase [Pirellulales bacterium]|nr:RsmD family RNA methyltransferase [Pirellulales bacterium]
MAQRKRKPKGARKAVVGVRIIGGRFRGRRLHYSGDARTRPMKDRLREAIFNLVGPSIGGKHALDLFAGTGALGLEALSRGAARATLIEMHHPTAGDIRRSVDELGVGDQADVVSADAFIWGRRVPAEMGDVSWAVFCSPPYDFYLGRTEQMLELIEALIRAAPSESIFVVESDARFDFRLLPNYEAWKIRPYPPAVVGIFRKR